MENIIKSMLYRLLIAWWVCIIISAAFVVVIPFLWMLGGIRLRDIWPEYQSAIAYIWNLNLDPWDGNA